ncbi:uncharacterized protein LOC118176889 [Oxyura jamaicensis]|uniref:uncharacterized protein LOC118176889 n=1 Tax=Oxyura jamaicensis TaxID=8884 RepID=UPI0015A66361|nr:uncharacterized protein LOC118176889 [Oxyura jamaicensis]
MDGAGGERQLWHRDGDPGTHPAPARTCAQAEPLSPRGLQLPALRPGCPSEVWGWWPPSLLGQARSPDTDAGCWQHGAVDHVRSQDVPREPAIVPGGRTMPRELPGHHGPLHTARPRSHLQLPPRAQLHAGVPPAPAARPALSCPPAALTAVPVPVGALGAAARHSSALGAAQSPGPSTRGTQPRRGPTSEPPCEPRPAAPAHKREGRGVTLRWSWDGVTGTSPRPREDLKPCLHLAAAWRCQPRAPCGCCRCSCSWGSAASGPGWWLQVSPSSRLDSPEDPACAAAWHWTAGHGDILRLQDEHPSPSIPSRCAQLSARHSALFASSLPVNPACNQHWWLLRCQSPGKLCWSQT